MSKWQPIETAPRDGTPVDLWFSDFSERWGLREARRETDAYWGMETLNGFGDPLKGPGWVKMTYDVSATSFMCLLRGNPTHWQPLPEPPPSANMPE